MTHEKRLTAHEKVLTPHEKVLIPHEKKISEAQINYNSLEASKTFFLDFMLVDRCSKGAI